MKTMGIIAEFNPFHNGHKYLIEKAKKITGAENAIIVCSGNYVQGDALLFMTNPSHQSSIEKWCRCCFRTSMLLCNCFCRNFRSISS